MNFIASNYEADAGSGVGTEDAAWGGTVGDGGGVGDGAI